MYHTMAVKFVVYLTAYYIQSSKPIHKAFRLYHPKMSGGCNSVCYHSFACVNKHPVKLSTLQI